VSPSVVLCVEGGAVVYGVSELGLVVFCWVGCGSLKIAIVYEGLYFCIVLLGG
jgi:hypothetical protein